MKHFCDQVYWDYWFCAFWQLFHRTVNLLFMSTLSYGKFVLTTRHPRLGKHCNNKLTHIHPFRASWKEKVHVNWDWVDKCLTFYWYVYGNVIINLSKSKLCINVCFLNLTPAKSTAFLAHGLPFRSPNAISNKSQLSCNFSPS